MKDINRDTLYTHRITQKQKDAYDKAWYKYYIDLFTGRSNHGESFLGTSISRKHKMQTYYNLYNNIINANDFKYVCKPYGDNVGELPADFKNRDICSTNIKVMSGMEIKRPFQWKVVAVNEEATSRKEQELFGQINQSTINKIMMPIQQAIMEQQLQSTEGRELSPEEQQQLDEQAQEQLKSQTPDEVKKYMSREHQDPAELQGHQLLEYFIKYLECQDKFNQMFLHGCISSYLLGWVGIVNGKPDFRVINPIHFECDDSDTQYIEDKEWAVCTYYMTPSEIVSFFSDSPEGLTNDEIDDIYAFNMDYSSAIPDSEFTFTESKINANTLPVIHAVFKSLRKIGFLTYQDLETGEINEDFVVNEDYKLNKDAGDIDIKWEWIPEIHEGYNIGNKFYKKCRPVVGQYKDLDNLYVAKLPYYGAVFDTVNAESVSPMGRMAEWQFLYNICIFRIEMLMASDRGKQVFMNIGMIPQSMGIDINKFFYYQDALKIGFMNPNEEGNKFNTDDISKSVKEVDMSLVSDIQKYIMLAEYVEKRCSLSIGITDAMRGQTAPNEAVTNNQMNYTQSSYILEPYYELMNQVKKNILTAILEMSKVAYAGKDSEKLAFVLDDFSLELLNVDAGLLDSSTFGLFIGNSGKAWDAKEMVNNLSQAALQNNKAELSDIIKILKAESIKEAEEILTAAEEKALEREQQLIQTQEEERRKTQEQVEAFAEREHEREKELIVLKEEERRKTELAKQAMLSMGFNLDKDLNQNQVPDVMEIYNHALDEADLAIKGRKQDLDERKFEHQKQNDREKNRLEEKRINNIKSNVGKKSV